jgi:hypothetical protein
VSESQVKKRDDRAGIREEMSGRRKRRRRRRTTLGSNIRPSQVQHNQAEAVSQAQADSQTARRRRDSPTGPPQHK